MQYLTEEVTNKKNVKKAIYLFIAVMVFLTFFSKTINNFMLPRVKTVSPQAGALIKEVRADGIVEGKEVYKAYVKDTYQVEDIKVQTGEVVSKGQVLMVIDKKDQERKLQDEIDILEQKKLSLEKFRSSKFYQDSDTDRKIAAAQDDLDQKRKNTANTKILFDMGAESKVNLEKAEADLRGAERTYNAALDGEGKKEENDLDIQNAGLDIQLQKRKIAGIQDELKTVSNVVAPDDGVITELNCPQGSLSDPLKPLYAIAFMQKGFELKVTIDSTKADYFIPGDEVEVSIPSSKEGQIIGKIRGIGRTPSDKPGNNEKEQKEVIIDIESQTLKGGEHAQIHIKKATKKYAMLLPNEAVRKDKNDRYVFISEERDGALGKEYFIQKIKIFCEDSDDSQTAVSGGLFLSDQVVCSSDKIVSEGDRVKLTTDNNSGDRDRR